MIEILIIGACIMLGLGLIAIGAHLWLAAKKTIAGIIVLVVGLILTLISTTLTAYMITTSVRGWSMIQEESCFSI